MMHSSYVYMCSLHICCFIMIQCLAIMAARTDTPDLLDPNIDMVHRSRLSAIQNVQLNTLRPRAPDRLLRIDHRWVVR